MYVSVRTPRDAGARASTEPEPSPVRVRVGSTVVLLGVVSMVTDISSEMVMAVLPLYLTAQVGLGLLAYGFIDGLYQGVSAVVRIAGGYAGDRVGRPKWVATAGYVISAASRIAVLPAQTFAAITTVITADRLGKGLRTAPRDALIADAADPNHIGRAFGVHRALDTLGATIGPILAFALLWWVADAYDAVFVVSFAFAIVGVAILVLFVPNRRTRPAGQPPRFGDVTRSITTPELRRVLVAAGLLGLLTIGDGFLYLSLQRRDDFAAELFPLLFVGTNVAYLVLAIPMGRFADRVGRGRVMVGGHVALLAAYLCAAGPVAGLSTTVACLLLLGVFYAATDGVLAALTGRLVAPETRGSAIAATQTVVVLARFAASVGFGGIWVTWGRESALLALAGSLAVAIPVAWWLLRSVDVPARPAVAAS